MWQAVTGSTSAADSYSCQDSLDLQQLHTLQAAIWVLAAAPARQPGQTQEGTKQDPRPEHGAVEPKALWSRGKLGEDGMPARAPQMKAEAYREVCD